MNPRLCVEDILKRGLDDWVQMAEIVSVVRSMLGKAEEQTVQNHTMEIIRIVIQEGLMKAGDVTQTGFHEWQVSSGEAIEIIERRWAVLGRSPKLGEICWLSNTDRGSDEASQECSY